jgi:hypothetical protein
MTLTPHIGRCPTAFASARSRFVIRIPCLMQIPYYIANGRGAETRACRHIEDSDIFARLRSLTPRHVAHHGETGRKSCLIHCAGTVELARIRTAALRQPLIPLGPLPTRSPIAETAFYLHGHSSRNPQPRCGCSRFPGRTHAPDTARDGRNQPLGTAGIAHHQPCHDRQYPTSTALHWSHSRSSGPYGQGLGIREEA